MKGRIWVASRCHMPAGPVLLVLGLLAVCGCSSPTGGPDVGQKAAPSSEASQRDAMKMFVQIYDPPAHEQEGGPSALEKIATLPDSDGWVMAILLNGCYTEESIKHRVISRWPLDRETVAALLANIRKDASRPLLWAVTCYLDDDKCATICQTIKDSSGHEVHSLGTTSPIREMARAVLQRSLGVDHGYNKADWCDEILGIDTKAQVPTTSSASAPK